MFLKFCLVCVATIAVMVSTPSEAAVCLGGQTDSWVNVEVCDEHSYCQSICIAQEIWDDGNGDGVETAAAFIHAISQRRVPLDVIQQDADQWTDRGKWKHLSPVVIWVEYCKEGLAGSRIGNICQ